MFVYNQQPVGFAQQKESKQGEIARLALTKDDCLAAL